MAGRKIDLNTNSAWDNFWSANEANKKGITLSDLPTDNMGTVASTLTGAITTKATQKAANGGGSSYNRNDLRNLVMRYAYDRFHGTDIDNNAWVFDMIMTQHMVVLMVVLTCILTLKSTMPMKQLQ